MKISFRLYKVVICGRTDRPTDDDMSKLTGVVLQVFVTKAAVSLYPLLGLVSCRCAACI